MRTPYSFHFSRNVRGDVSRRQIDFEMPGSPSFRLASQKMSPIRRCYVATVAFVAG